MSYIPGKRKQDGHGTSVTACRDLAGGVSDDESGDEKDENEGEGGNLSRESIDIGGALPSGI